MGASGRIVTGSTIIMPLSERFTRSTSSACRSIDMFLWTTPIPLSLSEIFGAHPSTLFGARVAVRCCGNLSPCQCSAQYSFATRYPLHYAVFGDVSAGNGPKMFILSELLEGNHSEN